MPRVRSADGAHQELRTCEDFDESRARALQYQSRQAHQKVREWIRANTEPGTVFLTDDSVSLYVVSPAGGKVVSAEKVFANVDVASREGDRFTMEDRIHENDRAGFCAVAPQYDGRSVIVDAKPEESLAPPGTFLEEEFEAGGLRILRVPDCRAGPSGN